MVRYTSEQHVLLCDTCVKYGSARKCRRKIRDERVRSRQTIHNLVNKLRSTGLVIVKKQKHKPPVFTEEKLDDTGSGLEHTPRKSLNRLAQETGVQKSNARTAAQLLKLRPYTNSNPRTPCSRAIQLAGLIFAAGFCSLSSKVRSLSNWHSFLMKRGFTCRDT
jgi:hypothetical protein